MFGGRAGVLDSAGRIKNQRIGYRYGIRFTDLGVWAGEWVLYASGSRWICWRFILNEVSTWDKIVVVMKMGEQ